MTVSIRGAWLILLLTLFGCSSLSPTGSENSALTSESQIVLRLAKYESAMREMNFEQVAACFAEGGEIVNPGASTVKGQKAIREFLSSFSGFAILEISVKAELTEVAGTSARQVGLFAQTFINSAGNKYRVGGHFDALWAREIDGQWRITRMQTTQDK